MKKVMLSIIMMGIFCFMPIKPMAMVELDENGNVIDKEVATGEVATLMAPDEGSGDQSVSSTGDNRILLGEDDGNSQPTLADDTIKTVGVQEDTVKTLTEEELYALASEGNLAVDAADEKNDVNVPIIIVTSSAAGIALGSISMYLFQKRKKQ